MQWIAGVAGAAYAVILATTGAWWAAGPIALAVGVGHLAARAAGGGEKPQ